MSLSWLIRRDDEPGVALERRTRLVLTALLLMANAIGTLVVFALAAWAFPFPEVDDVGTVRIVNLIAIAIEVPIGVYFGSRIVMRKLSPVRRWLESERPPTDEERRILLRAPLTIAYVQRAAVGAGCGRVRRPQRDVLRSSWDSERRSPSRSAESPRLESSYLVAERQLRAGGRAGARARTRSTVAVAPGIKARMFIAWVVGTAVPGTGLVLVAISRLVERDFTGDQLAAAVLALTGVALVCGLVVSRLTTRAVSDPVLSVRDAMAEVERGDLDVAGARLRRQRDRAAAGGLQQDGRRAARARADPGPVRPPGRRGGRRERRSSRRSSWAARAGRSRSCSPTWSARPRSPPTATRTRWSRCSTPSSRSSSRSSASTAAG